MKTWFVVASKLCFALRARLFSTASVRVAGADTRAQNLTPRDAPVAAPGAGSAASAITRPSPNGHQRSSAPPGFEQQGSHPDRQLPATQQSAAPAELATPLQELSKEQQMGKQSERVRRHRSGSGAMVIVTPVHPEGLKLLEERRRQENKTSVEVFVPTVPCVSFSQVKHCMDAWHPWRPSPLCQLQSTARSICVGTCSAIADAARA